MTNGMAEFQSGGEITTQVTLDLQRDNPLDATPAILRSSFPFLLQKQAEEFTDHWRPCAIVMSTGLWTGTSAKFCPTCSVIRSTAEGRRRCMVTDTAAAQIAIDSKTPIAYLCHASIVDFALPVFHKGSQQVMAVFIGGQLRVGEDMAFRHAQVLEDLDLDAETVAACLGSFNELPQLTDDYVAGMTKWIEKVIVRGLCGAFSELDREKLQTQIALLHDILICLVKDTSPGQAIPLQFSRNIACLEMLKAPFGQNETFLCMKDATNKEIEKVYWRVASEQVPHRPFAVFRTQTEHDKTWYKERFGMPAAGVNPDIKAIKSAAWRLMKKEVYKNDGLDFDWRGFPLKDDKKSDIGVWDMNRYRSAEKEWSLVPIAEEVVQSLTPSLSVLPQARRFANCLSELFSRAATEPHKSPALITISTLLSATKRFPLETREESLENPGSYQNFLDVLYFGVRAIQIKSEDKKRHLRIMSEMAAGFAQVAESGNTAKWMDDCRRKLSTEGLLASPPSAVRFGPTG